MTAIPISQGLGAGGMNGRTANPWEQIHASVTSGAPGLTTPFGFQSRPRWYDFSSFSAPPVENNPGAPGADDLMNQSEADDMLLAPVSEGGASDLGEMAARQEQREALMQSAWDDHPGGFGHPGIRGGDVSNRGMESGWSPFGSIRDSYDPTGGFIGSTVGTAMFGPMGGALGSVAGGFGNAIVNWANELISEAEIEVALGAPSAPVNDGGNSGPTGRLGPSTSDQGRNPSGRSMGPGGGDGPDNSGRDDRGRDRSDPGFTGPQ